MPAASARGIDVNNLTLEMSAYGKLVWNTNIVVELQDFDSYVTMGDGWINVDSSNLLAIGVAKSL